MSQTQRSIIDVKQAIGIAKSYITDAFAEDGVENIGLEEISFDDDHDEWLITIGFSRPWDQTVDDTEKYGTSGWSIRYQELYNIAKRTYKIVVLSASDGVVSEVKNRPV